jgi:hypothetical protein
MSHLICFLVTGKGKGKGKGHPITGYPGPVYLKFEVVREIAYSLNELFSI